MLIRAMKVLKFFEFSSWHAMGDRPMLPDSISEEKLKIEWKMEAHNYYFYYSEES